MKHTKEKILHTALELFSEKGFDGTSMQDIAGRVGLTKAALYRLLPARKLYLMR